MKGMVKELDPDAVNRPVEGSAGAMGRLDLDDASYERALLSTLFQYIRAGQIESAIEICRSSDQSWRAASLRGGRVFEDEGLGGSDDEDDEDMSEGGVPRSHKAMRGNRERLLWKKMCGKLASNSNLAPNERALYASLSGTHLTSALLPLCSTWEDHLWARINSLIEHKVDAALAELGGWWGQPSASSSNNDGDEIRGGGVIKVSQSVTRDVDSEEHGLEGVFEKILHTERDGVS